MCDVQTKILGKCFPNYEEALSVLKGRGVPGAAIPKISAVDVLTDLSTRTPDGVSVRYDRIEVTDKKLHLQGATDTAENVGNDLGEAVNDVMADYLRIPPTISVNQGAVVMVRVDADIEFY